MNRLLASLLGALLLAGCSSSGSSTGTKELRDQGGSGRYAGLGVTPPQPRPSFTLTDTDGKQVSFGTATSGHPTLLYFGYTNCPDVCPTTMADVSQALSKVPVAVARKIDVVFVSTDVKRDTGPVIAKWLSNFSAGSHATWIGLHGTQTQIDAAQAAAHVTLAEDGGATHSSQLPFYGPDNYAHVEYIQATTELQQIQHDLPVVAG